MINCIEMKLRDKIRTKVRKYITYIKDYRTIILYGSVIRVDVLKQNFEIKR